MTTYSYSRLETYKLCPLKYKFRYIDEIPEEVEGVEAFVGSRVHEVLEKLYKDLFREKIDSLEGLLAFYRLAWRKQWGKHVHIHEEGFTPEHYLEYGARCIQNYYEAFKPFNQTPTLGTEIHLQFSLDPEGRYKISGFIDRVARRADGTFEIHDYKTGRSLPSQEKLDNDRQLGLYEIGLKSYWPDVKQVELLWHYVGFLQTFRSRRRPEQLQILREETIGLIDRVECQKQFDPVKGAWCTWCEYRALCPLWKHVEIVGVLPPAEFAADEGVKLATEYAQTKSQIDRLQGQLEALRESIIEFARQK
jgi:putative RecB family exonuclease